MPLLLGRQGPPGGEGRGFTEVDIEKKPLARQEMIQKANGRSSVPQIFIGDHHVGGCDDLYALDDGAGSIRF